MSFALRHLPCSTSYPVAHGTQRRVLPRHRTVALATPLGIFDAMDRQFEELDRQFDMMQRQMDRDIDTALRQARELERQADAEVQRALRESASSGTSGTFRSTLREDMRFAPSVDIQRQEERGPGSYRYYERIQITSGSFSSSRGAYTAPPPPAATSLAAGPNPAGLVGVLVAAGAYTALTVAFNRNFHLTTYAESKRWLLLALWPLLVLFSPKFREQFAAVIKGVRPPAAKREGGGESGGSGSAL